MVSSEWVPSEWESKHDKNITIIHTIPSLNCCFWPKYKSRIHNNTSSSEKSPCPVVSHIKIHQNICLGLFWTVSTRKKCLMCISLIQTRRLFVETKSLDWYHVNYFWIIMLFYQLLLETHSDGTHPLQRVRKWCNDVSMKKYAIE